MILESEIDIMLEDLATLEKNGDKKATEIRKRLIPLQSKTVMIDTNPRLNKEDPNRYTWNRVKPSKITDVQREQEIDKIKLLTR